MLVGCSMLSQRITAQGKLQPPGQLKERDVALKRSGGYSKLGSSSFCCRRAEQVEESCMQMAGQRLAANKVPKGTLLPVRCWICSSLFSVCRQCRLELLFDNFWAPNSF